MEDVSNKLRTQVYKDFYGQILKENKLFKLNFSQDLIEDLTTEMKEMLFGPGEIIFQRGEMDERLFFLNNGRVELYLEGELQQGTNAKD